MSETIGSLHNVHVQTKINVSLFFDEQQINSTSFPTITNNTFLYTSTIMNIHTRYIYLPCYIYVVANNSIKIKIIIHHHHHHHHPNRSCKQFNKNINYHSPSPSSPPKINSNQSNVRCTRR